MNSCKGTIADVKPGNPREKSREYKRSSKQTEFWTLNAVFLRRFILKKKHILYDIFWAHFPLLRFLPAPPHLPAHSIPCPSFSLKQKQINNKAKLRNTTTHKNTKYPSKRPIKQQQQQAQTEQYETKSLWNHHWACLALANHSRVRVPTLTCG